MAVTMDSVGNSTVNGECGLPGEEERFSSRRVAPGSPFFWLKRNASLRQPARLPAFIRAHALDSSRDSRSNRQ